MARFVCPACGATLDAKPHQAGLHAPCGACGSRIRVPGPPRVSHRVYRGVLVALGVLNGSVAVLLGGASMIHAGGFFQVMRENPVAGTAFFLCLPATLAWLCMGVWLSQRALRRRYTAGLGLMAHSALEAMYVLAFVLQPDLAISGWARAVGTLLAGALLFSAYVSGVESGRRLARPDRPARARG